MAVNPLYSAITHFFTPPRPPPLAPPRPGQGLKCGRVNRIINTQDIRVRAECWTWGGQTWADTGEQLQHQASTSAEIESIANTCPRIRRHV